MADFDKEALEAARQAEFTEDVSEETQETVSEETAEDSKPVFDEGGEDNTEKTPEQLARERGWKPADEWKGEKPDGFVDDPEEYNRRHEDRISTYRREVRELKERLDRQENAFVENVTKLDTYYQKQLEKERKEADEKLVRAFNKGNAKEYEAALKERDDIRDRQSKEVAAAQRNPQQNQPSPEFVSWYKSDDAKWYREAEESGNPDSVPQMRYAKSIAQDLAARGITAQNAGERFYTMISDEVKKVFPEEPRPKPRPGVEGASTPPARSKGKKASWDRIPSDVKNDPATQLMLRKAYKGDKQKFAEVYFEGES